MSKKSSRNVSDTIDSIVRPCPSLDIFSVEVKCRWLALGGAGPNAILCKTCSVLLSELEQPIVVNLSTGSNWEQLVQLA
jgi:hypothetical protein